MPLVLPTPDRGVVLVVSGPSGAGKSTLIAHVLDAVPGMGFSVSATTRPARAGEADGRDYHFLTRSAYDEAVARGAFLEHAEVYGHGYGTPRGPVVDALQAGRSVLLDIDVQGAAQVRASLPEAVHAMILPPSLDALERRLRARGTDDDATIARRMRQADAQLQAAASYDYLVINDDLAAAKAQLLGVVVAELARASRHARHLASLVDRSDG